MPTLADTVIQSGLSIPWDLAFAPDGRMFVTIRSGQIRIYASESAGAALLSTTPVTVHTSTEAGLMGIALDPAFATNGLLYVCASRDDPDWKNQVLRYRASGNTLSFDGYVIRDGLAANHTHDGCRLRFSADGKLWLTMGDADDSSAAQDPNSLNGKVLRINTDGSVPADNPILPGAAARTAAYTMGHRNPQGLAFQPGTGAIFEVEHGADTHDEINILVAGANYGWPTAQGPDGSGGFADPAWSSGSSTLATSGATFVTGSAWDSWQGSLFVATLKESDLRRFVVSGTTVTLAETLLDNKYGRLRSPVQGPDGALYITTSNGPDDKIIRLGVSEPPPPPPPGSQTVTFDDRTGQNQPLSGQYPAGVINWGSGAWFHSGPWRALTTKSVSFNGPGVSSATFTFVTSRRLLSVIAFNGGSGASTITLSCSGQTTRQAVVSAGTVQTISTGWSANCGSVTIGSTNGWDTNFDDLVHDAVSSGADTTPPAISGVSASSITEGSARIQWTTDEPADTQVEYGTTSAYGSITVRDPILATGHSQQLTGLSPSTIYHYRVRSRDAAGNLATSSDQTFTTNAAVRETVTFDDLAGQNQPLDGEYPVDRIDWGSGSWYHSGPWRALVTKSISFRSGMTNATFFFISPRVLVSVRAFNGGAIPATVTLSCANQPTVQRSVAAGELVTITTSWAGPCASVDLGASNGWDTNFDDIVHAPPS